MPKRQVKPAWQKINEQPKKLKAMRLHPSHQSALTQYKRNGRWGTCGDCPRDGDNRPLPELCKNTARQDHNLRLEVILEQINKLNKK